MTVNLLPPLLLDDRRLAYNPGNTPSQPMLPHDRPLSEVEFVAFDLETTSLFRVDNRIVEFGAVRFRLDGQVLSTWEQLVDPECPIPPGVAHFELASCWGMPNTPWCVARSPVLVENRRQRYFGSPSLVAGVKTG